MCNGKNIEIEQCISRHLTLPLSLSLWCSESVERSSRDTRQSSTGSQSSGSVAPDPDLVVGSMVEVLGKPSLYGVIRWIGDIVVQSHNKLMAGLEMVKIVLFVWK